MKQDQSSNASNASSRVVLVLIFFVLIIASASLYMLFVVGTPKKPIAGKGGAEIERSDIGGHFTLTNQDGDVFDSDSLLGKPSLIYFGFSYCPDICPTSLDKITKVMQILDKYNIDITPVFITVDPLRDTAFALKSYIANFHPKFIALTGSQEQITEVANKFKVYYAISPDSKNKEQYMLDHSSFVYLMDKNGRYLRLFYMNSTVEEIVEFIQHNCR